MGKRQWAMMRAAAPGAAAEPLGTPARVRELLAGYNTAPDGGKSKAMGMEQLHGPGFIVEYPSGQPTIMQTIVSVNDEDCAWPVLQRVCRQLGWRLVDLESGRTFG